MFHGKFDRSTLGLNDKDYNSIFVLNEYSPTVFKLSLDSKSNVMHLFNPATLLRLRRPLC